jgi:GT2 family glycosyltransferase
MDAMSDRVRCSVIIPSYNSESTIVACLESVLVQDINEPYEVIMVDSSSDATPELVREKFPSVRLKHFERRVGSGTARNIGVEMARGDILAFTDSDCVVESDWLRLMVGMHEKCPEYAAVGGPITNGNPQHVISWAGYLAEFNQFLPKNEDCRDAEHIPTSNVSFKCYVFERYGGFPGDEFVKHEDMLFSWWLHNAGEKFLYHPAIRSAHCHRTKLNDYLHHQFNIGQGTVQTLQCTSGLRGSTLVRHRVLVTLMLPLLPVIKLTRSTARFLAWRPIVLFKRPLILPLFALGLLWWAAGFAHAIWSPDHQQLDKAEERVAKGNGNGATPGLDHCSLSR